MNSQKSRKFVVAIAMAAVVGIAVVTFALRSHSVAPIAQSVAPAAAVAQIPDAPAAVVQTPDAAAAVSDIEVVASRKASTATSPAAEPKRARTRNLGKADVGAVATDDTVARVAPEAAAGASPAITAVATNVDPVKSVADLAATPATLTSPTDDQKTGTSTVMPAAIPAEMPASDGQITMDVKSEIAVNSLTRDVNIGVSTTDGVVALTGNLASQDAIDHVKDLVAKVKDVKSVDTSALIVANL
jgi:hyperosmotically inducible protein